LIRKEVSSFNKSRRGGRVTDWGGRRGKGIEFISSSGRKKNFGVQNEKKRGRSQPER